MTVGAGEELVAMKDFGKGSLDAIAEPFDKSGQKLYVASARAATRVVGDPEMRAAITAQSDGRGAP